MQLVIKDGIVISFHRDEQQVTAPDGAEVVRWDGPLPEPPYQDIDGIRIPTGPALDPRTPEQILAHAKERKLHELAT